MNRDAISRLFQAFEALVHREGEVEFWLARELQVLLAYTEWRNFEVVLDKAREACANAGQVVPGHFVDVNKMVQLGLGAQRVVVDVARERAADVGRPEFGPGIGARHAADMRAPLLPVAANSP